MRKSLVAFDTDHIKGYVFGTDRLKEIRGGSALLDDLNRIDMLAIAKQFCREKGIDYDDTRDPIYLNGGSGLFLLMTDRKTAEEFGERVQKRYRTATYGGASITCVVHELPEDLPDDREVLLNMDLHTHFEMLRYRLREAKGNPADLDVITLPSHPFMRSCDSCGINYGEKRVAGYDDPDDLDNSDDTGHYCYICYRKQKQNNQDKKELRKISRMSKGVTSKTPLLEHVTSKNVMQKGLWQRILFYLDQEEYDFQLTQSSNLLQRPKDFNVFRDFAQGEKDYLGLIYADANNMGIRIEGLDTLAKHGKFAKEVDRIIHVAMSKAIKQHLKVLQRGNEKLFPFDVLLLGGDDLVMVTHASKAMDVAYTIAKEFYELAEASKIIHPQDPKKDLAEDPACTLSIGVVLAPIKYPFSLLRHMAEDALKAAKKKSLKIRQHAKDKGVRGLGTRVNDSCINFVVVTGGSIKDFDSVDKNYNSTDSKNNDFHATLRPYDLESLELLLNAIKEGHRRNLGRTKLHALREAVVQKNLTTSVSNGLAVLRNWRQEQRTFAMTALYEFGGRYTNVMPETNIKDPVNGFPSVTFPWFVDQQESKEKERKDKAAGKAKGKVYRTTFLDFIELFDFVTTD